ncbi:hypothetical protein JF544_09835 [Halobacillus kuroshimensis]|uniref:DksA C4-type domain-containing protein n=1 Tax=Halobacillus kuroshimensis TaxID=302481 RepID=A0ABS3DW19_9BACI|nr:MULTISPECIES: hypothetical protein [Halobacillus]MBN8235552.1 hypothetical protein [Halobacillus kuroshimensis]
MLSDKQIQQFKQQIIEMKEEAEQEMEKYKEDDAKELYPNDRTGEISSVADHPGNLGTDQHEREKRHTFYEQAREKHMEAEDALKRIEEGRYGVSEKSGDPIPVERLEALPTARYTVEEEREIEKDA